MSTCLEIIDRMNDSIQLAEKEEIQHQKSFPIGEGTVLQMQRILDGFSKYNIIPNNLYGKHVHPLDN